MFAVWSVMAAIYITMFYDFAWGGLGTSNSKGLSFISSLSNRSVVQRVNGYNFLLLLVSPARV